MKRNYGIDLLRIVATYGIFLLHILGWGGVLDSLEPNTSKYLIAWTLEMIAYVSVNCYALISGYVGIEAKYKYTNIVVLLVRVLYHTLMITLLFSIFYKCDVNKLVWLNAMFPVLRNQYWYLNAYVALFIFIPVVNVFVEKYYKYSKIVIVVLLFVFSVYSSLSVDDIFYINKGYSAIWLIILYIVGAMIRKGEINFRNGYLVLLYLVSIIASVVCICYLGLKDYVFRYNSPFVVLAAISLLLLFAKMKVGSVATKVIKFVAPSTLFLYIIHANPLIWNRFVHNGFVFVTNKNIFMMAISIFLIALGGFLICLVFDKIRVVIFELLKINEKVVRICELIKQKLKIAD